ncbi:uncharacterized protein LOC111247720 isoform X1 [Varroa destructor]|uniref:G-protein coupled receptors family 1 profile domain-containing protein n=2 Tax=Varroa destructor TaxID=109461 RepID=A0A7M7JQI9_VARDE|nr:uncharacterized protein LOC111247720 isoform X1 [Varroa destructor]XP_022654723.1 uncharacterized protein LOC111247720 isoform X1 [Varroa destructor]
MAGSGAVLAPYVHINASNITSHLHGVRSTTTTPTTPATITLHHYTHQLASQHRPRAGSGSCHPAQTSEAIVLFTIAFLGVSANLFLMSLILTKKSLRRWSQGLLFHQGFVDCVRALLLVPMGLSVLLCQRLPPCALIETCFLLLVTVSTVNLLVAVLNDVPLLPDQDTPNSVIDSSQVLLESPQCIMFGLCIIWFAAFTVNLGPTFLSGALYQNRDPALHGLDVCPIVYGPVRHYVLNILWIGVNLLCVGLMGVHLRKLFKDLHKARGNVDSLRIASLVTTVISMRTDNVEQCSSSSDSVQNYIGRLEREGIRRVKMFVIMLIAYIVFWGPLFSVTLLQPVNIAGLSSNNLWYQISLHVAFVHSFVNPTLLLSLHGELRSAASGSCHTSHPAESQEDSDYIGSTQLPPYGDMEPDPIRAKASYLLSAMTNGDIASRRRRRCRVM